MQKWLTIEKSVIFWYPFVSISNKTFTVKLNALSILCISIDFQERQNLLPHKSNICCVVYCKFVVYFEWHWVLHISRLNLHVLQMDMICPFYCYWVFFSTLKEFSWHIVIVHSYGIQRDIIIHVHNNGMVRSRYCKLFIVRP